jgi:hypothetical protein
MKIGREIPSRGWNLLPLCSRQVRARARACICFAVAFLSRFLSPLVSSDSASTMAARAFCSRIRTRISAYFMVQTLHLSFIPFSVEQTEKKVERIFFRLSMMVMMRCFSFFTFVFSSVSGVKCKDGWFFFIAIDALLRRSESSEIGFQVGRSYVIRGEGTNALSLSLSLSLSQFGCGSRKARNSDTASVYPSRSINFIMPLDAL